MKIDFIAGTMAGGGAERVLALIANFFAQKGSTVRIITFNEGDNYELDSSIIRVRLHEGRIKNHKIRSLKNLFVFYKKKNNRPDVIISFMTRNSLIALLAAKFYKIKIICSEHTNHLKISSPIFLTYITRVFFYRFADQVTVLTNFDIRYYKNNKVKVRVLPNPCTFEPLKTKNNDRKKIILAVGDLNRYVGKGFDNLITLVSPILKENKDWTVKIVGGGDKGMAFLQEQIRSNQMDSQIILTGFRNDVNKLMFESEIFILPSLYEGLPMALLEAMSQGMACIAYDCKTGPADIIEHGVDGLLIEDQNMKAMQKELLLLMNNPQLRDKLRNQAIKSLDRFSIDNIAQQWEELFKELQLPK